MEDETAETESGPYLVGSAISDDRELLQSLLSQLMRFDYEDLGILIIGSFMLVPQ